MNVHIGKLPVGHWRFLALEEIDLINKFVKESSNTEEASRKAIIERKPNPAIKKRIAAALEEEKKTTKKPTGFKEFRKAGKK
jgi:hypothetical protein